MKDAQMRIPSLMAALALLLLVSFTADAQAADRSFLSDLHEFRVSNYKSLDAYYQFSAAGDTETLNEIVANINNANNAMNGIGESTSGALSGEQVEQLNQEFDKFKDLMRSNINDVRTTGYPDLRLVSDMANHAVQLNQVASNLYSISKENSETTTNPRIEAARSAAVTMSQMMAKYSARTYSQVAQTFQGSSTDLPLDEQARAFDQLLGQLNTGESEEELKSTLNSLNSKWQFIRMSYINYNDNNVAFVIDRYSKGILDGLGTTIELLGGSA